MANQVAVIVGGGLAAARAAETLRKEGYDGRVVIVGDEEALPYERPPLSKEYLLGKKELAKVFAKPEAWYAENAVELMLGRTATALDLADRTVALDGGDTLGFDKVLIATGANPRRLGLPGADLDGVQYLRRIADSDAIKQAIQSGLRIVIVGAGWIGLEVAAAAAGHADVTVVEPLVTPLERVLGPEMGEVFAAAHVRHGVDLQMATSVAGFRGSGGRVQAVLTSSGTEIPAEFVVVGIGALPNKALAEGAAFAVEPGPTGGVLVDDALRTKDPDVFAVGDVASAYNPLLGKHIRVEHWANARNAAPFAARAMLGQQVSYDRMPYFYTDQYDIGMEYTGYVEPGGYDRVVTRGDVSGERFVAFWLLDGRVQAAMHVNEWDAMKPLRTIVTARPQIAPDRLADADVSLEELATAASGSAG
jgi:3-phenylpropionate/trans-cinnamate dioxygenase ferredoxin reductase component